MKKALSSILALAMILTMIQVAIISVSALQDGDYTYTLSGTNATITAYTGAGGAVTIPNTLDGYTVTAIGTNAFANATGLSKVTIPESVTDIGASAFYNCTGLTSAYLLGNAPTMALNVFTNCASTFEVYYLSGKTGYSNPWNGYVTEIYVCASLAAKSGSTTVINHNEHYIYGLIPDITPTRFENDFIQINGNGSLVYTSYMPNGFGTGTRIDLIDNVINAVVETYYMVIFGDVNGDNLVDSTDAQIIFDYDNGLISWDPITEAYYYRACDVNGDHNYDSADGYIILDYELEFVGINQVTGLYYAF